MKVLFVPIVYDKTSTSFITLIMIVTPSIFAFRLIERDMKGKSRKFNFQPCFGTEMKFSPRKNAISEGGAWEFLYFISFFDHRDTSHDRTG